ncbi:MAG: ankyrin repeat domain-containing protein [Magnetococcales bacterium]|nr:ankyrin repeat domain-containing protein [Magnetococcales bacterium]
MENKMMVRRLGGLLLLVCTAWISTARADEGANEKMWQAILEGTHADVTATLDQGANVNAVRKSGMTPLMWAAQDGDLELVKMLLAKGANHALSHASGGCTALGFAAEHLQLEVVKTLIGHGAAVEKAGMLVTPLMKVSRIDVSKDPKPEETRQKIGEMTQLLIDNGADVTARNDKGMNPLMLAAKAGNLNVVAKILDKVPGIVNEVDKYHNTALMLSARYGKAKVAELLLAKGAEITRQHTCGCTALLIAAENGHLPIVKMLLDKGSDINAKNNDGMTALMFAASKGHRDVVQELLSRNARINEMNNEGKTARTLAVEGKHDEVEEMLHASGGRCS